MIKRSGNGGEGTRDTNRGRLGRELAWLAPPLLVGAILRLWGLADQVLGGDEMHAVQAATTTRVREILTAYGPSDSCMPLSAFYRVLLWAGLELSEMRLRLPVIVSGLGLLACAPPLLRPRIGAIAAIFLAWLLAISPILVLYSGIVRSYMPVALLELLAVVSFDAWWRGGRAWLAGAYAALAAAAVWFHLGAAPFAVAPLVFGLGVRLLRREGGRSVRALVVIGAVLAGLCACFLVPATDSLLALIEEKRQPQVLTGWLIREVFLVQAGTTWVPAALVFWVATLVGLQRLLKRVPAFGWLTLTVVLVHGIGLRVLSPVGLDAPISLNRYLIVVLPLLLTWAAVGLGASWAALGGRRVAAAVAALVLVGLLASGPLVEPEFRRGSFRHHNHYVSFASHFPILEDARVPAFYRQLSEESGGGAVLEYPWSTSWSDVASFYGYQAVHGRRVMVAPVRPLVGGDSIRYRNVVLPEPEAILASEARWFVLHRNLGKEELRRVGKGVRSYRTKARIEAWTGMRAAAQELLAELEARWPAPAYADEDLVAWDLDAIR